MRRVLLWSAAFALAGWSAPAMAQLSDDMVKIGVATDMGGLYADIMEAISQSGTNIRGADLQSKDGNVFGNIYVEVDNLTHLAKVLKAVRRVKGVITIDRRDAGPPVAGTEG